MKILLVSLFALVLAVPALTAAETLDLYVIDTEGGKAVIVVPPGGETMLIDAGYPTPDDRDTNRIVAAAQALGIKSFDYIVDTLKSSPGLQDLWQLHYSNSGQDKNAPADFIANPVAPCEGKMIKVSARRNGTFTVTNTRNGFSKTYKH